MGQAWCKERSSKAQDSKSPLDRVFLRCAHRLYPGLKEEGSVLGGATQRVTSSEIGYAGSPSRDMLTRGSSIDSVDRPFQPSDWVDVNLEVPNTPRASSAMTNRTFDTTIYHTTTPSSSSCNLKNATPVPPPRRKKKIRDRPLPPKPDEASPSSDNSIEPLYSSINKIKNKEKKNNNEFLKINDIDKTIPSVVVSGWKSDENISSQQNDSIIKNSRLSSTISLPNYDELITSNKINNHDTLSCDEIDDSIDLKNKIILDNRKTSTPIKNNNNIDEKKNVNNDGWLLNDNKNISESLICDSVENKESKDQSDIKSKVQSFLVSEGSKDDLFFDAEDTKRTCSLDRHKDPELKKFTLLKRSLSNDSETFENFEDKRLSIAPSSQTDSTPKNLTRSISEESFPSVLMEYQDDFFDEKIVKDTKNEITKIREELEAVKNEVKTPSSSPEPIIKPDIQKNDSSLLLNVINNNNNENEESNLSSMTPSLNELEAALSDMLEKTDEHDNYNIDNNDIYETPNDVLLENPIEPNIVKLISDNNINELVDIDLNNDTIVNGFTKTIPKIRSLDRNDHLHPPEKPSRLLRISLDSLVNNDKIPTPPKRKNRNSIGFKENSSPEPYHNDRLI